MFFAILPVFLRWISAILAADAESTLLLAHFPSGFVSRVVKEVIALQG